ncbi:MAG: GNAT family N-acetyltransferase [Alphaproteobacteria bacterium]
MRLRLAMPEDADLLRHWDSQPHVAYATGSTESYDWPRELARDVDWRDFLIAESGGRPIGLVVLIDPAREETHYWGDVAEDLRALDIWIGDLADTGKGYGEVMMRLACDRCFGNPAVQGIIIDPLVSNVRAIWFYERLGFRFVERRRIGSDDIHVMRLDRAVWQGRETG